MTTEQLDEIKQLAEARLRVGDLLAPHCLQLHMELKAARAENERMKSLLARARGAIHDGFIGGEWAHLVFQRDSLSIAAHKEADEAEEVVREIAHLQGAAYGESNYWVHNYNQTQPLGFDEACDGFSQVKEHVDDYKAVVAEHEETIRYWQAEAHRIERERRQVQEERDNALSGIHAACGNRHPEGSACVLETARLVVTRTKQRDRARAEVERLRAALKIAAEGVCFAQNACGCAVCVARKAL